MNINVILQHVMKPEQARRVILASSKFIGPVSKIGHKFGPEILTGVGVAGGVTAAVLGARATLKVEPILDRMHDDIATVEKSAILIGTDGTRAYDDKTIKKTLVGVKVRGALEITKLYTPAITLGIASIGCILAAHGIMKQRNVALVAAYNALEKTFSVYRKRVVEEFGEDKDRDFRYGFTDIEKTNKKTGEKSTQTVVDPSGYSIYTKVFDNGNLNWTGNSSYNLMFLKAQQQFATDKLRAQGHLFLNDVYDMLGFDRTKAGSVTGWFLDKDNDNYVDFGMYDVENVAKRNFINGFEKNVILDFNVDGLMWDKLDD